MIVVKCKQDIYTEMSALEPRRNFTKDQIYKMVEIPDEYLSLTPLVKGDMATLDDNGKVHAITEEFLAKFFTLVLKGAK